MKENEQNNQLNKKVQMSFVWPVIMLLVLVVVAIGVMAIDLKAGFIATIGVVIYAGGLGVAFYKIRTEMATKLVNFALEYGQVQKKLLQELDVPYGVLDEEGRLLWANDKLKQLIDIRVAAKGIQHVFHEITPNQIPYEDKNLVSVHYENYIFRVELLRIDVGSFSSENDLMAVLDSKNTLVTMYMFDETEIRHYQKENQEQKLVCGTIFVDNYEEALNSTEEVRRSLLAALIERKITKYMQNYDAIIHKTEKDRFQFVTQQKYLPAIESGKFSILDEIREINIGNELPVTLCIGVGVNGESFAQCGEWSRSAIDLALGRGGDQAVVKDGDKISYYGGKIKQVEKSTRVRARVKAHAFKQLLEGKTKVMVMGHRIGDVDSFGASIGIYRIARTLNKEAHVVINEMTNDVKLLRDEFAGDSTYGSDMFLNEYQAKELIDDETVLVVVDVNRASYTECPELLNMTKTIVVLDHHRQSSEALDGAVLSYIEPYASSACEMVAEILQYIADGIKLRPIEANAMFAGLIVDTNNFLNKTGVRTFEAAAYLKKSGADTIKVRTQFREDLQTYKVRAQAVAAATIFDTIYAFSVCQAEGLENPTVVGAQIANELLNITGVKASFVFTEIQGTIYISARSYEEVNVQLVMEKFGGGGHSAIAGAQIADTSVEAAMTKVKMQLRIMKNEGEI